jgi:adenylate cyclase
MGVMERKLTAILCADIFGYSRLMGGDEEATLRTLSSHRKLIDSLIEQHRGRFVNSAGDSVLAEFASVVNAVQCAVEIQTTLKAENASLSPERRMEFRMGVNLGDVMVEGEQIYGDGVNVAARLESLAQPGGICISGKVHDEIRSKLALGYQDLGAQQVKNITEPVRVLRVMLDGEAATHATAKGMGRSLRKHWRGGAFSLAGLALIAAVIVFVQHLSLRPTTTTASIPPAQQLPPPLPDMPSIAVLPLTNMSGDREQEYFSDGITDDLITALSRLPGLFVIARTSSFTYKGKAVGLQEVGKELGVKYVLGGGVRRAGDQVRITVQLADATTGEELWAERYDRPLRDIFALQDEIVRRIVTTLNLQLTLAQRGFLIPRETDNLEAYDDVLRGVEYFLSLTKDGNVKAREMFEKAIQLDPKYARAYAGLGLIYYVGWGLLLSPDPNGLERALQLEQQAIALDDSLSPTHRFLARIYVLNGQYDQAVIEAERAIALDPNSALGYDALAEVMNTMARPAEALAAVEKAMRLDPRNPGNYLGLRLYEQGFAYTQLGRYEEAIPALKRDLALTNNLWDHVLLVLDYIELGQEDAARADAAEVERRSALNPNTPLGYWAMAGVMNDMAEPSRALVAVEKAMRLDPGNRDKYLLSEGLAYLGLGRYEDSITAYKGFLALHPDIFWAHLGLAVDDIEFGRDDAARAEAAEVLRLDPQFNLEMMFRTVGPKGKVRANNVRWSADLRKAGLK